MSKMRSQSEKELTKLVMRATEVSTLPQIIAQIVDVANNPRAAAADLSVAIESDPSMTARVLRFANSASHGLRTKVESLQQAVSYLGFKEVRNLAVTAAVCDLFKKDLVVGPYKRHRLWAHLIAVAVTARVIARHHKISNPDEIFLAGLLHDLGILILDQHMHETFVAMMKAFPEGKPLYEVEREAFGFDHMTVGAAIAEKWGLPELVRNAMRLHHGAYLGEHAPAIACVELANIMVSLQGMGSIEHPIMRISPSVQQYLKLGPGDLARHSEQMTKEIEHHQPLIGLVHGG